MQRPVVRCVLWTPRGMAAPAELIAELERKRIEHVVCGDAHGAFARLCTWGAEARQASGGGVRVLVMIEPGRLVGARALLDAMERFAPDSARWVYQPGANPSLRALVESDVASEAAMAGPATNGAATRREQPRIEVRPLPAIKPRPIAKGTPALRLTEGDVTRASIGNAADEREDGSPANLLTDEELSMLLGEDEEPGEAERKRPKRWPGR